MKRLTNIAITLGTLFLFALLGTLLPRWTNLEDPVLRWSVRAGLWLLGIAAAALVFWLLKSREGGTESAEPRRADDIDVLIAAAQARLAAARGKANARFGRLPLILVAGPTGTAKTTIITRSGMEPELLAGEVHRGDSVVPTAAVNVWLAQNHLVLEAGGRMAADAGRWRSLLRHLQPSRLAAALTRGRQAPRLAVVCFGCDELLKPGAAEAVPAAAQKLRSRLAEVAQQLGIRLPVYVIFTKADRLPYFEDFVRSLTRDEARDVLGATLPILPPGQVGQYAERESHRLADAFNNVFRGLAMRRLDVMPRETQDVLRAGAYEFPREFRKVQELATQFLIDLCRPSQLGVSPFLRGFYFTGVRAVYLHDAVAAPVMQPAAGGGAIDATGVFDPRMLQRAMQPAAPATTGSRKVPEWTFLERVFRDVILRDNVAQGVTAGGTKVNFLRRVAIATAAAAFLVFGIGMSSSCYNNRRLLRETQAAVEGASSLVLTGALPELEMLERLDALRQRAEELDRYASEGPRMSLRWGLYAGNRVQPVVRQLYFERFDTLLWEPTRASLNNWLASLPDSPNENSDYEAAYDALKAHLVTTAYADSAREDFLAPELMKHWLRNGQTDSTRQALAQAQFAFFARELSWGNPFADPPDSVNIRRTRTFLQAFSGSDQLYRYLLASAGESLQPVTWSHQTVRNGFVVPAAFTSGGWAKANVVLQDVQRLLNREPWVVESVLSAQERQNLEKELRARYTREYIDTWTRFLRSASIAPFAGVDDAANKLRGLTTNPSPLLQMIGLVSNHTYMDSVLLVKPFSPAHMLAAPNVTTPTETGGRYIGKLTALLTRVEDVARAAGPLRLQAQAGASTAALEVRTEVTTLAQQFDSQGDAQIVGAEIRRLLEAPVFNAEAALGRISVDELNGKGRQLCASFTSLGQKFPFNPRSTVEATVQEVTDLLAPGTGFLWAFYNENLQSLLTRTGSRYVRTPGSSLQSTQAFLDWFNAMAQISNGLFNDQVQGPQLHFALRMENLSFTVPDVTFTFTRTVRLTATTPSTGAFEWNGTPTPARLIARVENDDVVLADAQPSPWSLFRLFQAAQRFEQRDAGSWTVAWRPAGQNIEIVAGLSSDDGFVLRAGALSAVGRCVSSIAR